MAASLAARSFGARGALALQRVPRVRFPHVRRASGTPAPPSLWGRYNAALERHPLPVKMATSTVIALLGDAGCQVLVEGGSWDAARAAQIGAMGFLLLGPGLHFWYGFLARIVPGAGAVNVAKKLALDQLLFAPVAVGTSLAFLSAAQGQAGDIPRRLREQVPGAVVNNWKLWPAAQLINLSVVPLRHQVLFANGVSVLWNGYLSWSANREKLAQEASAEGVRGAQE